MKTMNKIYIALVALVFAAFAIVFDTFPRSTFSVLENATLLLALLLVGINCLMVLTPRL